MSFWCASTNAPVLDEAYHCFPAAQLWRGALFRQMAACGSHISILTARDSPVRDVMVRVAFASACSCGGCPLAGGTIRLYIFAHGWVKSVCVRSAGGKHRLGEATAEDASQAGGRPAEELATLGPCCHRAGLFRPQLPGGPPAAGDRRGHCHCRPQVGPSLLCDVQPEDAVGLELRHHARVRASDVSKGEDLLCLSHISSKRRDTGLLPLTR